MCHRKPQDVFNVWAAIDAMLAICSEYFHLKIDARQSPLVNAQPVTLLRPDAKNHATWPLQVLSPFMAESLFKVSEKYRWPTFEEPHISARMDHYCIVSQNNQGYRIHAVAHFKKQWIDMHRPGLYEPKTGVVDRPLLQEREGGKEVLQNFE